MLSSPQVLLRKSQVWDPLLGHQEQLLVLPVAGPGLPKGRGRGAGFIPGQSFQVLGTGVKSTKSLVVAVTFTLWAQAETTHQPQERTAKCISQEAGHVSIFSTMVVQAVVRSPALS